MSEGLAVKADLASYIILGICFGNPAILAGVVIAVRPELFVQWFPVFGGSVFAVSLIFVWLGAFRLQATDSELIYRTLFSGEMRVRLHDVSAVRRVIEFNPWSHWGQPRNRLEVFTGREQTTPYMRINLKVFRKGDVAFLLQLFKAKLLK